MPNCGIYKITSLSNKIYIGQSKHINVRIKQYMKLKCKRQPKLYQSLLCHGAENHIFEIIELCDFKLLNIRERYWQDYYEVISGKGLNLTLTKTENIPTEKSSETRLKMRNAHIGKKLSESQKLKISQSNIGKRHTETSKTAISLAKKGVKQSKEHLAKLGNVRKGKKASDSTKLKMSMARKGKTRSVETRIKISNSKKGYKKSETHKENHRLAISKIVLNLETGIYYYGNREASEAAAMHPGSFAAKMSGRRKNDTSFSYV